MDKTKIVIVTGTGGDLGNGHFQRMLNLALTINKYGRLSASIYLEKTGYPIEEKYSRLIINQIPRNAGLIIRDMRDSEIEEIMLLKEIAKVLVVDDSGPGKKYADYTVTLLPVPSEKTCTVKPDYSLFLYGRNFTEGIAGLEYSNSVCRDIDITVYAGYNPPPGLVSRIKKSIPSNVGSVILKNNRAENLTGEILVKEEPYSNIITRSRIVITHFGLTMFEAYACGCRIAALNPTSYHRCLTEIISKDFKILYSDEYSSFTPESLMISMEEELRNKPSEIISSGEILKKINSGAENFVRYINMLLEPCY